jgi:hypothetical protein
VVQVEAGAAGTLDARPVLDQVTSGAGPELTNPISLPATPGPFWADVYTGTRPDGTLGSGTVTVGLGGAFLMMVFQGEAGMPRRYWSYAPLFTRGFQWMAALAAVGVVGACILAATFPRARDPSPERTSGSPTD